MKRSDDNPLHGLEAGSHWVDCLLNLFWTLDTVVNRGDEIPDDLLNAYLEAEQARRAL